MQKSNSCLIVGAGLAGLTAGQVLQDAGWNVVLVEKARAAGGRMATRRIEESHFDHGAQFFTVRDLRFQQAVDRWQAAGWVKPWFTESGHVRYRGVEGMNGIGKELSKSLDVRLEATVIKLEAREQDWRTTTHHGDTFATSAVLLTAPVPQSISLLAEYFDSLTAETRSNLRGIAYQPCFALLVTLHGPSRIPAPGYVRPQSGPVAFIADNTRKGISTGAAALTIHAQPEFTQSHEYAPQDEVIQQLLQAAKPWLGSEVRTCQLHIWRYSQATTPYTQPCIFSPQPSPLAFAGDGFGAPRIEGAFLSGLAAAHKLMSHDPP